MPPDTVVWARGLPESSLAAARRARSRRPFPLVCSLGDPLPPGDGTRTSTDGAVARVASLHQVRRPRPSRRSVDLPEPPGPRGHRRARCADRGRCFVVPHLLPDRAGSQAPEPLAEPGAPTEVVYAGSAYRWLLSGPLLPAVERAAGDGLVRPVLALRDAGPADREQVERLVPSARVHYDLDPAAAAALIDGAGAVVAPGPRADLLYTKVVEALRHGRPVLTITPVPGTTAELATAAGGIVVDRAAATAPTSTGRCGRWPAVDRRTHPAPARSAGRLRLASPPRRSSPGWPRCSSSPGIATPPSPRTADPPAPPPLDAWP